HGHRSFSRGAHGARHGAPGRSPASGCRPPARRDSAAVDRAGHAADGAGPRAAATRGRPRPMKCPSGRYLGVERVERARNCGSDFSLGSSATFPDLNLRSSDRELTPLDDLSLVDAAAAPPPTTAMADARPDVDRLLGDSKPSKRAGSESAADFSFVVSEVV